MAIDTATLKKSLKAIFDDKNKDKTTKDAADAIADALEVWIKSATVQVTAAPSSIQVTGSPSAMANANAIVIKGSPASGTTPATGGIS